MPLATLRDVVLSVQDGRVDRALAPVENALEGGVDPVLDALALEAPDVALIGEVLQPVSYCLAAGRELALDEITMVRSHPQALGQCKHWLAEHMPGAAVVPGRLDRRRRARGRAGPRRDARRDRPAARGAALRRGDARRGTRGRPRQHDPLRLDRAARRRAAATGERPGQDARSSSGAWAPAPPGGWSRAWRCSRSPASTSPGSSRARCAAAWASTCSSSTSRARWPILRSPVRSRDCARHAELVRVLGSFATDPT